MNRAWQGGIWRITILFTALLAFPAAAQNRGQGAPISAAETEILLQSQAVSWGEAARYILAAAGVDESADEEGAFRRAAEMVRLPRGAEPGSRAGMGGISLVIMKAFGISGGMYRFFPGARYAYRELVFLNIIQGPGDPDMTVSGERFLHILGRALEYTGTGEEGGGDE
jgi:hypothetical protein